MNDRTHLADRIAEIAVAAGHAILEIYEQDFDVITKDDDSPLTQADLASHRVIHEGLSQLTPDWPLLSEESASIPWETRQGWDRYWLVDPLDGTKEFINRNGEFTVNIALIENGRPVLGVVYVPVRGTTYLGAEGSGARKRENGEERAIAVRTPAASPPMIVASRSHPSPDLEAFFARIGDHERVSMGSSLKFCLVAEGEADFYPRLGLTSEWDTAAAQAVVEAAGGRVVQLDGTPLPYNTKDEYLNPYFLVCGDPETDWVRLVAGD